MTQQIAEDPAVEEDGNSLLAQVLALTKVNQDGQILKEGESSLLDRHYPPDSICRLYLDTILNNVRAKCQSGATAVRYPATIQHHMMQLLPKIGKVAYIALAKYNDCMPSYRVIVEMKTFLPISEIGPLPTSVAAARLDADDTSASEMDR